MTKKVDIPSFEEVNESPGMCAMDIEASFGPVAN